MKVQCKMKWVHSSGLHSERLPDKKISPSLETIGVKNEFGFDTVASEGRSVAKRMSEFLTPIVSNEGCRYSCQKSGRLYDLKISKFKLKKSIYEWGGGTEKYSYSYVRLVCYRGIRRRVPVRRIDLKFREFAFISLTKLILYLPAIPIRVSPFRTI